MELKIFNQFSFSLNISHNVEGGTDPDHPCFPNSLHFISMLGFCISIAFQQLSMHVVSYIVALIVLYAVRYLVVKLQFEDNIDVRDWYIHLPRPWSSSAHSAHAAHGADKIR